MGRWVEKASTSPSVGPAVLTCAEEERPSKEKRPEHGPAQLPQRRCSDHQLSAACSWEPGPARHSQLGVTLSQPCEGGVARFRDEEAEAQRS